MKIMWEEFVGGKYLSNLKLALPYVSICYARQKILYMPRYRLILQRQDLQTPHG